MRTLYQYILSPSYKHTTFTQDGTTQALIITRKLHFYTIKRRTFTEQHKFYIFDITNKKKLFKLKIIIF